MARCFRLRAFVPIAVVASLALTDPQPARAIDGASATSPEGTSYYEGSLDGAAFSSRETAHGGLPTSLAVVAGVGGVDYVLLSEDGVQRSVRARVTMAERPLETVSAVYALVLALPLPVTSDGEWRFDASTGLNVREGTPGQSVVTVYGGEKVVLRRDVALERAWLPLLAGGSAGLPDLSGSGYAYTLWEAVVRHEAAPGATAQGFAELHYTTDAGAALPDPSDDRLAAYLVTWIPTLDPGVAPYAVRLDVVSDVSP